jgi:predicted O-methyltransferase YrrM
VKGSAFKNVPVALQYMRYRLVSSGAHDLHSPFVFDLYSNVIRNQAPFYAYRGIESLRSKMLLSAEKIDVHDLGTGGEKSPVKKLALNYIAKHYLKPAKYGQLLFRLVNQFHPIHVLELGTSLGITAVYLASPHSDSKVVTIEGCPNTAGIAKRNFNAAKVRNIEQVVGEFGDVLPGVLEKIPRLDFVYFDGNHRKDATLHYFKQCLLKRHELSVFVFDDIHWSSEMQEAWKIIQQHEAVTLTIDLFSVGIVFFREGFPKQHFVLKY